MRPDEAKETYDKCREQYSVAKQSICDLKIQLGQRCEVIKSRRYLSWLQDRVLSPEFSFLSTALVLFNSSSPMRRTSEWRDLVEWNIGKYKVTSALQSTKKNKTRCPRNAYLFFSII
jgi:hypothetical protein